MDMMDLRLQKIILRESIAKGLLLKRLNKNK